MCKRLIIYLSIIRVYKSCQNYLYGDVHLEGNNDRWDFRMIVKDLIFSDFRTNTDSHFLEKSPYRTKSLNGFWYKILNF